MKKVITFIGTASRKATYHAVQEFEKYIKSYGEIDFEYVFLHEYNLEFCQGCKLCFNEGEEFCPLKDDRDVLLEKIENSDGVIFATPSYAFQVSGRMKNFLDRSAYIYHRPKFFGKTFTAIITQGIPFGGKDIRKYLEGIGGNFGFYVIKGACLWTLAPITERRQKIISQKIEKAAKRFYKGLNRSTLPQPSLFRLVVFRMTRTSLKSINVRYRDYFYFKEKGWFESGYYYDTSLGPIKKLAGRFFDYLGRLMAKRM